jgi:hypothetical protein
MSNYFLDHCDEIQQRIAASANKLAAENSQIPVDHSEIHEIRHLNSNHSGDLPAENAESRQANNLKSPDPGPTPSPTLEERLSRANRARRCEHLKANGVRCGSPALREYLYCYFHQLWRAQAEYQPYRPDPNAFLYKLPLLEDANGVQIAIQQVLDAVVAGRLDLKSAHTLLYGLQTASTNVRLTSFDSAGRRSEMPTDLK